MLLFRVTWLDYCPDEFSVNAVCRPGPPAGRDWFRGSANARLRDPQVCYPFRRKHGRDRAVNRLLFTTLFGGAVASWPFERPAQVVGDLSIIELPGIARARLARRRATRP
jgi:hypothetical protein